MITDGGSNQEESYYLGKPCLIIRTHTERTEGLQQNVVMWNNDFNKVRNFIVNYPKYRQPKIELAIKPSTIITECLSAQIEKLEWDSNFFHYPVGRLIATDSLPNIFSYICQQAQLYKYHLIYIFVHPQNNVVNKFLIDKAIPLVDEKVTYIMDLKQSILQAADNNLRNIIKQEVTPEIVDLALQSGEYSRFKIDPNFKNNEFKQLYQEWIKKSLSGELAKSVIGYYNNSQIKGILTIGDKNQRADIGLLAVHASARGQGIGKKMVQFAINSAKQMGYRQLQVITQKNNLAACQFYEKCGFKVESVDNIYHLWLD